MPGLPTCHFFDDGQSLTYWTFGGWPVQFGQSLKLLPGEIVVGIVSDTTFTRVPKAQRPNFTFKAQPVKEGSPITRYEVTLLGELSSNMIVALVRREQPELGLIIPLFVPSGSNFREFQTVHLLIDPADFEQDSRENS